MICFYSDLFFFPADGVFFFAAPAPKHRVDLHDSFSFLAQV